MASEPEPRQVDASPEPRVVIVLCTVPAQRAEALVDALLTDRLIACANLLDGVQSRYWWQGKVELAQESLLLLKTRADLCPALRARIVELHPYDVPEIVELAATGGLASYLNWVASSCRGMLRE